MLNHPRARWALVLALAPLLGLTGACKKGGGGGHLSLIPASVQVVGGVAPGRIQQSELYKKLGAAQVTALKPKADAELPGVFDYLVGLQAITFGVGAPAGKQPPFVVILQGPQDPAPLLAQIEASQKAKGKPAPTITDHKGIKIYSKAGDPAGFAVHEGKIFVGSHDLLKQSLDLAKGEGQSVETNAALMALVGKTKVSHALWGAGTVPPAMQDMGGKVKIVSASGSLDFAGGLDLDVTATTPAAADATKSVAEGNQQLTGLKTNPMVAAMGMAAYLEGIKLTANGADARLNIKLSDQQVNELIGRVQPLLQQGLGSLMGLGGGGRRKRGGEPPALAAPPAPTPAAAAAPRPAGAVPAAPPAARPVAPGAAARPPAPAPVARPAAPAAKPAAPGAPGGYAPR